MPTFFLARTARSRWLVGALVAAPLALAAAFTLHARSSRSECDQGEHAACALKNAPKAPNAGREGQLPTGPAVVELTSEACPACRRMEPVLRDARAQCSAAGATVVDLDVESVAGGALATQLQVTETPTLVFFDAAHHEVARLSGARSLPEVRTAIEHAYGIACATLPAAPRSTGG